MTISARALLASEPWAITEEWMFRLAAIVARRDMPDAMAPDWNPRDYAALAGPSAQRLQGSHRAFVDQGVAIVQMFGPMFPRANQMTEHSGATSSALLAADIRTAAGHPDIGAIMIQADTPGGATGGLAALADAVAAASSRKPVVVHVDGAAASAGYWVASQASEIVLDRNAYVGSIGVVTAVPVQVAPDADGVQWIEVVSSRAPNKRPSPLTEEGMAEILGVLDAIEGNFVADVARGRHTTIERVMEQFGKGGLLGAADAVKRGMADRIGSYGETLGDLRRRVGVERRVTRLRGA